MVAGNDTSAIHCSEIFDTAHFFYYKLALLYHFFKKIAKTLDEIEKELGIATCPVNWPIGSGKRFKGVYDRHENHILTFSDTEKGTKEGETTIISMDDEAALMEVVGEEALGTLRDEIELLDGASVEFDLNEVRKGKLTPVFFGSALTNFGVEIFLQNFLSLLFFER